MVKPDSPLKKTTSSQNARADYSINDVMILLQSLEEKHDKGLKIINSKLSNNDDNFKILKKSLDELTTSFDNLKKENNLLKKEISLLRDKVQTL